MLEPGVYRKQPLYLTSEVVVWTAYTLPSPDPTLWEYTGSDEEVVDPKATIEVTCKPKCVRQLKDYQACTRRIDGDESGSKHCTGQYFDYWQCIDKCVAPKLFEKLK